MVRAFYPQAAIGHAFASTEAGVGFEVVERGDERLKDELLRLCRDTLPRHKVPVALNFVPVLDVNATGKMVRQHA